MAFPPRPPLMSGMPVSMVGPPFTLAGNLVSAVRLPPMSQHMSAMPSPMNARPPMRPMMHSGPPLPPRLSMPPTSSAMMVNKPPTYSQRMESSGPAVTVFMGNITERAPDVMIRHILNACGPVLSWKRVQGASGKLQGFGFCEYANPDAALRAIRLLHGYEIATNKLVVKADSKNTEVLDEYKEKRRKAQQSDTTAPGDGDSPLQDEKKPTDKGESNGDDNDDGEDSYVDVNMRAEDRACVDRISMILHEHKKEILNYVAPQNRQDARDKRMSRVQEKLVALSSGADIANIPSTLNLDDMEDVEEGKRELISREITQFREQMKKQEEEKERDRKVREKDREREKERFKDRDADLRQRDRERDRDRRGRDERRRTSRTVSHSPPPPPESREGRRIKEKHRTSRSRSRTPSSRRSDLEVIRERERGAEEKEKKEQERKIRKKEMQYQERLKNWESREHKKQKELDREAEKERGRESDREKDARKLKEFLEDYDDERDDHKFYKGHNLERKLQEREHEKENDAKDRAKEKEELEELRAKIASEGHEDPDKAYEQAKEEREEQYKPVLLVKPAEKPLVSEVQTAPNELSQVMSSIMGTAAPPVPPPLPSGPSDEASISPADNSDSDGTSPPHSDGPTNDDPPPADENSLSRDAFSMCDTPPAQPKKRKLDVKDVFNQDDDDTPTKKKKLPMPGKDKAKEKAGGEEKRKHIKGLIDKIPTSKAELFAYPIEASYVDTTLMEKRIRPWINKKIIEYIGEPEPLLVEFICSKVLIGSEPQALLNEVQMVLDDEAEVFVVKMWRLLIYEIEAKKLGLGKT